MSRPILLIFLLVILIITSQFEWRQPLVADIDATPSLSLKQQQISKREETVKEKIILSQERHIQRQKELIRSLQQQLMQCRGQKETKNSTQNHHSKRIVEIEKKHILED